MFGLIALYPILFLHKWYGFGWPGPRYHPSCCFCFSFFIGIIGRKKKENAVAKTFLLVGVYRFSWSRGCPVQSSRARVVRRRYTTGMAGRSHSAISGSRRPGFGCMKSDQLTVVRSFSRTTSIRNRYQFRRSLHLANTPSFS